MLQINSDKVMATLRPTDVVLDIGGWAHPFNRANYVMDAEPYETRGYYNRTFMRFAPVPPIGGTVEHFSPATWIRRDICEKTPFPFADKSIDFVICSHTLEDIRDPLWVCSEMIRIGKAGYIETPSRLWETCRGIEPGIAGISHHRWLVEVHGNRIDFFPKLHRIHEWCHSLPTSVMRSLAGENAEEKRCVWLFWHDNFDYREVSLHGNAQLDDLARFVSSVRPYPPALVSAYRRYMIAKTLPRRAIAKAKRILARRSSCCRKLNPERSVI